MYCKSISENCGPRKSLFFQSEIGQLLSGFTESSVKDCQDEDTSASPALEEIVLSQPLSFEANRQRRTDAHHGMGGRARALTGLKFDLSICSQIAATYCRLIVAICGNNISEVPEKIRRAALDVFERDWGLSFPVPSGFAVNCSNAISNVINESQNSSYEAMRGPFLAVCSKITREGKIDSMHGYYISKHTSCSCIDAQGGFHCTCIGSTAFRITGPLVQTVEN